MKQKIIILTILLSCIVIFGKNHYIQCYKSIEEYCDLRTKVLQEQDKVKLLSEKTEELMQKSEIPELSQFKNLSELSDKMCKLQSAELKEISALEICSEKTALYIATIENPSEVVSFTDRLNGVEFVLSSDNIGDCLTELSTVDCLYHRISIDQTDNLVYIQIIIV